MRLIRGEVLEPGEVPAGLLIGLAALFKQAKSLHESGKPLVLQICSLFLILWEMNLECQFFEFIGKNGHDYLVLGSGHHAEGAGVEAAQVAPHHFVSKTELYSISDFSRISQHPIQNFSNRACNSNKMLCPHSPYLRPPNRRENSQNNCYPINSSGISLSPKKYKTFFHVSIFSFPAVCYPLQAIRWLPPPAAQILKIFIWQLFTLKANEYLLIHLISPGVSFSPFDKYF